jgi:hypothetical protein
MRNLLLASAAVLIALTATAQAEIICTNRGCYETGMRIYRNGSPYVGTTVIHQRDDGRPKKQVRIRRYQW